MHLISDPNLIRIDQNSLSSSKICDRLESRLKQHWFVLF